MPTGHSPRAGAANAPSPVREFQGLSAPLASGRGTVMGPRRRSRGPTASPVVALDPATSSRDPSPVKLARFPVCTDPLSPAEVLADGTPPPSSVNRHHLPTAQAAQLASPASCSPSTPSPVARPVRAASCVCLRSTSSLLAVTVSQPPGRSPRDSRCFGSIHCMAGKVIFKKIHRSYFLPA